MVVNDKTVEKVDIMEVTFECDGCIENAPYVVDERDVVKLTILAESPAIGREAARNEGWSFIAEQVLCPDCTSRDVLNEL